MRIYLAGKVRGAKWDLIKGVAHEFVASDCDDHGPHLGGSYLWGDSDFINQHFISKVNTCDALIAYLDRPDSFGSIAEIAWASAKGKNCLIISSGIETEYGSPLFDAYWFVSSFPNVKTVHAERKTPALPSPPSSKALHEMLAGAFCVQPL